MKMISVEKMKELESTANEGGYTFGKMMKKAGENLAQVIHEEFFSDEVNNCFGLVGRGNNGGDTLVALTKLQQLGWTSTAILLDEGKDAKELIEAFVSSGGTTIPYKHGENGDVHKAILQSQLIIDGLLGTGFRPPLREPYGELLQFIGRESKECYIVAVDCPSGVDCVSGDVSEFTLKADLTVCMEAVKEGLLKFPAFEYCGEIRTVELGIPQKYLNQFENNATVIDREFVKKYLPTRPLNSHKGVFGHLIVCGGSVNYPGAPMLAARSAYRVGAGLVECAIPGRIYEVAASQNLESIFTLLEDEDGVIAENAATTLFSKISAAQCMLLGPGIGREETTLRFVNRLLFASIKHFPVANIGFVPGNAKEDYKNTGKFPPLVIDADALRLLTKTENWFEKLPSNCVLTPHPGEMSALTGLSVEEIQKDRVDQARRFAQKWGQVVVLKGAISVVASPEGQVAIIPYADSALAKAGTGDVLAGMIAGFITQGIEPYKAAFCGVWLHARAAAWVVDWQGNSASLMAGDLIEAISPAYTEL